MQLPWYHASEATCHGVNAEALSFHFERWTYREVRLKWQVSEGLPNSALTGFDGFVFNSLSVKDKISHIRLCKDTYTDHMVHI